MHPTDYQLRQKITVPLRDLVSNAPTHREAEKAKLLKSHGFCECDYQSRPAFDLVKPSIVRTAATPVTERVEQDERAEWRQSVDPAGRTPILSPLHETVVHDHGRTAAAEIVVNPLTFKFEYRHGGRFYSELGNAARL